MCARVTCLELHPASAGCLTVHCPLPNSWNLLIHNSSDRQTDGQFRCRQWICRRYGHIEMCSADMEFCTLGGQPGTGDMGQGSSIALRIPVIYDWAPWHSNHTVYFWRGLEKLSLNATESLCGFHMNVVYQSRKVAEKEANTKRSRTKNHKKQLWWRQHILCSMTG